MRWRNTTFWELAPTRGAGPQIQVTSDSQRVLRNYLVGGDPDTVRQAILDFLGNAKVEGDRKIAGSRYIARTTPHFVPRYFRHSDQRPYLWATGVNVMESYSPDRLEIVDGFEGGDLADFKFAKLQVTYIGLRYKLLEDADVRGENGVPDESTLKRYVTRFPKPINRVVTLPRGLMKWVPLDGAGDPASTPVTEGSPLKEPGQTLTLVWHQVPEDGLPYDSIEECMGAVNSTEFAGYKAGTLLCEAPEATPLMLPDGSLGYDVSYKFTYLPRRARHGPGQGAPRGHNWFPRYLKSLFRVDYRRMNTKADGTGDNPYPAADFADLFRPDSGA